MRPTSTPVPDTSRTSCALSYAILLGGFLTIAVALYMVVTTYSSLPFWGGWRQVEIAANGSSPFSPAWLWQQHNEHRMVIPKLFLAADLRLFQARQVFLLASISSIQFMHLALLSWSMWALGGWRGALWRTGTGLAAFCLFCPSQWENLIWGFQVCFVLPQLFATLSFVALLLYWTELQQRPDKQPSPKFLVVSVLAALGATYSLASGNLLWPLLVAAALYLRLRLRAALSFAITGALSTALYLYHYVRPQAHANPMASLGRPLALFNYCALYFLSSWLHQDSRGVTGPKYVVVLAGLTGHKRQLIALAALALFAILAKWLHPGLSYIRVFRPFAIQVVLTMLFCIGTEMITATGRLNFGTLQATAPRYQTVALLFWCSLGLLLVGSAFFARPRMRHSFMAAQVCLLVIFARGAVLAKDPISDAQAHGFTQKAVAATLITGLDDPATLSEAYPQTDMLSKTVRYMRANRLSVFSGGVGSELGKPLESVFPLAGFDDCAGGLESAVPIDNPTRQGLRIVGWALDLKRRQPASAVVVTTNGIITGLGAVGAWRPYVHGINPGLPSSYNGFVAFVPEPTPGSVVDLYAILRRAPPTACYINRIMK
ncbi:MAG: hypothetical protein WBL70_03425 [Candidatus Acidiferrales bacterium]